MALAHDRPEAELKTLARLQRGWDEGLKGIKENAAWSPILAQAQALEGHFHQLSVHPGGTIIGSGPLWHHVPTEPAPAKEGVAITAWDKDGVEDYGLVKIDLLGNRSLAVVRDALEERGGRAPDALRWQPRLDPATQELLAKGDSMGVFCVESPATRQLQQRVGKGDFETLVIHSSLMPTASAGGRCASGTSSRWPGAAPARTAWRCWKWVETLPRPAALHGIGGALCPPAFPCSSSWPASPPRPPPPSPYTTGPAGPSRSPASGAPGGPSRTIRQ